MAKADPMLIDASATKDFFISILIRDIDLSEAIVDLVDNSVDGARTLRGDGDLTGLFVHLKVSESCFEISDNCGGISPEVARKYAFRFGRNADNPKTKHSVGQFGVGMKRAIFKLGNLIKIDSASRKAKFSIDVDVAKWKNEAAWDLQFSSLEEKITLPESKTGTKLSITQLNEGTANELKLGSFQSKLKNMIEAAHAESIGKGLEIKVGEHVVSAWHPKIFSASEITPLHKSLIFFKDSPNPVTTRIYAGIAASNPSEAGWYIICNGRAILTSNQSLISGWGEGTPRFHNQYARFRGFVYFDSNDAGMLPWNTTKTNVDSELPLYQATRLEMINAMKPVLEFLNKLDREKEAEERPLTDVVERLDTKPELSLALSSIPRSESFQFKVKLSSQVNKLIRIQYQKPAEQVEKMKRSMKVTANSHVGENSFDYYFRMECDE